MLMLPDIHPKVGQVSEALTRGRSGAELKEARNDKRILTDLVASVRFQFGIQVLKASSQRSGSVGGNIAFVGSTTESQSTLYCAPTAFLLRISVR